MSRAPRAPATPPARVSRESAADHPPPAPDDPLEVLFRLRTHLTELLAHAPEATPDDVTGLEDQIGKVNEQINEALLRGFEAPVEKLRGACEELERLNTALIDARQGNQAIRQGIEIGARVVQVTAGILGAFA